MRTTTNVNTPAQRAAMCQLGERRAVRSQWRLILCVSILRTALTRVLPLCGAAGWWVTLICLAPALGLYGIGRLALSKGKALSAGTFLHGMAALAMLLEALASMTALITLFTQGIGAQGTQQTLAAATAGLMLFCLHEKGLPRGVFFLRWPLLVLLAVGLSGLVGMARLDNLWPWQGGGTADLRAGVLAGLGMGWPLMLALMEEPVRGKGLLEPVPPVILCVCCVLCVSLALPHELLTRHTALADSLLVTVAYQPAWIRLAVICLWLAALFLAIACLVRRSASSVEQLLRRKVRWLPGLLAGCVAAFQWIRSEALWQGLSVCMPWLLGALGIAAVLSFIACRRE